MASQAVDYLHTSVYRALEECAIPLPSQMGKKVDDTVLAMCLIAAKYHDDKKTAEFIEICTDLDMGTVMEEGGFHYCWVDVRFSDIYGVKQSRDGRWYYSCWSGHRF
jgi:hypothetical protein